MVHLQDETEAVQEESFFRLLPFKKDLAITAWEQQFLPEHYGKKPRCTTLVLVGGSRQGKTMKGMSIFGETKTLKVRCEGCPKGVLPDLNAFTSGRHVAILFDECRIDQILTNREFFQSSVNPQQLSQSLCTQGSYEVWGYQTAMIVCTNHLPMTEQEGLSASEADWMHTNMLKVTLEEGQTWFHHSGLEPPEGSVSS